jgi:diguanylate cyclase (GGDEF)-like protein
VVTAAGLALSGYVLVHGRHDLVGPRGDVCIPLCVLLVLAELWPVPVPRAEQVSDEITLSSTFGVALLFIAPLPLVIVVQTVALVADSVVRRRLWSRLPFNVGQYALAYGAAAFVYHASQSNPSLSTHHIHLSTGAAVIGGLAFFLVNNSLIAVVLALQAERGVLLQLWGDLRWQTLTAVPSTALAPAVAATAMSSPWLLLCLLAPLVTVVHSSRLASRREHEALHDVLTGLGNRAMLVGALDRTLADPKPARHAILMVDLDHFKDVNDTLGHHIGDALLIVVAGVLSEVAPPDSIVARLGGDEFAMLIRDIGAGEADHIATRLVQGLRQPRIVEGTELRARGSVGIAYFPDDGLTPSDVLRRADVALYKAKEERDGYVAYEPSHDSSALGQLTLVNELTAVLDDPETARRQLVLAYQPLLRASDREMSGVECLVRWDHPRLGRLLPADFLPAAEHAGLTGQLGRHILEMAAAQHQRWAAQDLDVCMSVNVFVTQLSDTSLPEVVGAVLGRYGLRPGSLILEVTEDALISDPERSSDNLRRIRATGVRISIDDYGAGYSSLAYLKNHDVDELKIDRQFVMNVGADATDRIIVQSTIDLGHQLGLRVVAEGVEDEQTAALLAEMSCDLLQGYELGSPVPAEAIAERVVRAASREVPVRNGLHVVRETVG